LRTLGNQLDNGIDGGIDFPDARKAGIDDFTRTQFPGAKGTRQPGG